MDQNAPAASLALWLADHAASSGDTIFIARNETRLDQLARACAAFCAGRVELLTLPPWDTLPYDRAAPSAGIVGRRVRTLLRLLQRESLPRLLLIGAEAALQLVPGPEAWSDTVMVLEEGAALELDGFRHQLGVHGYHVGESVVDRGEVAFRERVVDLFPADADRPVRLLIEDGRIAGMHRFDPTTQRSHEALPRVEVFPASEYPLDPRAEALAMEQGEAVAPTPEGELVPVFRYAAGFAVAMDEGLDAHWEELRGQIDEAYRTRRARLKVEAGRRGAIPPPAGLFLTPGGARRFCRKRVVPMPRCAVESDARTVGELVKRAKAAAGPVVIMAPESAERLARGLARRGLAARAAHSWMDVLSGGVWCFEAEVDTGFQADAEAGGVLVLQASPLLKSAVSLGGLLPAGGDAPRVGDIVVHAEHGAARLTGLKPVEVEGMQEERLALAFHGGAELLVPTCELDRVWRYGTEGATDRMDGAAWRAKRGEVEAAIGAVAEKLAEAAAARNKVQAPSFAPDPVAFERLSRRFPHALSPDQMAATVAVLDDLKRGRPMHRLVCGDVGFGKTEVALRAAAAVALAGGQVAVAAPTTVLARQHLETFRKRFAGTPIRVEGMIGGEDKAVLAGLRDGSVGVMVGTQGLASEKVKFARLGLVVVDEEQRFGEGQKHALAEKDGQVVHLLSMTATPIPRTMQMAMTGLRDVSVIATAPMRRQPTRTVVLPCDDGVVRDALTREHGRGGQSFVVCPRIADLGAAAALIRRLVPKLHVVQAHGRMKAEELEAAVLGFAEGDGDILLATNIIEAGLDIPRANTIIVMQPDRFGLAQLHQMRGRVGRGSRRGVAYLLMEPGRPLAKATTTRLHALEAMGSLGAGIAISAADLDQRGAGELFGEAQAGHVSALGTELYQELLVQAVRSQQGEKPPAPAPLLHVGLTGSIPETYVPEVDLRISLYRRLARFHARAEVDAFEGELLDRFGPLPAGVTALLALARLRCACARRGVSRVDAGPKGAKMELFDRAGAPGLARKLGGTAHGDGLVLPIGGAGAGLRVARLTEALEPG